MDFSNKKQYNRKITFKDPESFSNANENFIYRKQTSNISMGIQIKSIKFNSNKTKKNWKKKRKFLN